MIDVKDSFIPVSDEATIYIHLSNGESIVQTFLPSEYDVIDDFMSWCRRPGKDKVFTIHCIPEPMIILVNHAQILAVDVYGYIEPEGRASRWYERLWDKVRVYGQTRKL